MCWGNAYGNPHIHEEPRERSLGKELDLQQWDTLVFKGEHAENEYWRLVESESESFYSVLLQTQETSVKTISGRCRRGHLEKSIHECMYVKIILINKSKS